MRLVRLSFSLVIGAALLLAGCGADARRAASPSASQPAEQHALTPSPESIAAPQLFFFVATECPISNGYAPEMVRIARAYESRGVRTAFVYSDPDLTEAAARQHAAQFSLDSAGVVVTDPTHETFTRPLGATLTPEAAVAVKGGGPATRVLYLGRIDDLYVGFGKRRHEPTVRDLRNALDAVLAGKPVPPPGGRAIGCSIPGV